jgi:hypothetical protein
VVSNAIPCISIADIFKIHPTTAGGGWQQARDTIELTRSWKKQMGGWIKQNNFSLIYSRSKK